MSSNETFDDIISRQFDQERFDRINIASNDPDLVESVLKVRTLGNYEKIDFDLNTIIATVSAKYGIDREGFKTAWSQCEYNLESQIEGELFQILGHKSTDAEIAGSSEASHE